MRDADLETLDTMVLDELRDSVDGDRAFVVELIEAYLADAPVHIAAIDSAAASGDAATLVRPAHTLKSSSATLGLQRLAAAARELEMAGKSGALEPGTSEQLVALHEDWDAASRALRTWAAEDGPG